MEQPRAIAADGSSTTESVGEREMPCPACGYDLRAITSDRCPECGAEVDRQALDVGRIPWTQRRQLGRVKSYLLTAWQFSMGSRTLADGSLRLQVEADGRLFARVTGVILAVVLAIAWVLAARATRGELYTTLAYEREGMGTRFESRWIDDWAVPWSAGFTLAWMMPLAWALVGYHLATVQRTLFRARGQPIEARRRAVTLGSYSSAPLLILAPAICLSWVAWKMIDGATIRRFGTGSALTWDVGMILCVVGAGILWLMGLIGTFICIFKWFKRATGAGVLKASLAILELLLLWGVGFGLFLFALPWGAGIVRIWFSSRG